jgi:hypothetical protein
MFVGTLYILESREVMKIQMKPIKDQRMYDNTLYFKFCILLPVICIANTSFVSLLNRLMSNYLQCYW